VTIDPAVLETLEQESRVPAEVLADAIKALAIGWADLGDQAGHYAIHVNRGARGRATSVELERRTPIPRTA
jgi:hypothetical protein